MINSETAYFEILSKPKVSEIKCVVLDYDGTLTTLRKGWDLILTDYARGKINPNGLPCDALDDEIRHLCAHAGGTTPKQLVSRLIAIMDKMNLIDKSEIKSLEFYAKDYADHFQEKIDERVKHFAKESESYVITAVRPMLDFISSQKTLNYIVTGSCETAVKDELQKLEMLHHFEKVYGASLEMDGNLKLDAMNEIIARHRLSPCEVLIIGDGSTETRAATELKLPVIGIASDEHTGGLCSKKRDMLAELGAHAIISDYSGFANVWNWLHEA